MFPSLAKNTRVGLLAYLGLALGPGLLKLLGVWFAATNWWWVTLALWAPWVVCFLAFVATVLRLCLGPHPAPQPKDSQ